MLFADRSVRFLSDHSSECAHVTRGHGNGYHNAHGRLNARARQQQGVRPRILAAQKVQPAKRGVLVSAQRVHDARSAPFGVS